MKGAHPIHGAAQTLERLGTLPGGPELLAEARRREDVALVGGAVRDLLLGHWPRELDVTVAADAAGLAETLAAAISPSERAYGRVVAPVLHERFRTASLRWAYGRIDVAELRAESYPSPGALPDVRPGSVEEDLARRDFTINAISLPLGGEGVGLLSVDGALEDLAAGTLRVLHERSFRDDPTRILRLARYAARLRFTIETHTRRLAEEALADGALSTVSGGRVGAELLLALGESDARATLGTLEQLGVLEALGFAAPFDDELAASAEALLPRDGRREALLLAVALLRGAGSGRGALELLDELEVAGETRDRVLAAASGATELAERLARPVEGLDDHAAALALLDGPPVEAVALAGALAAREMPAAAQAVGDWLTRARHVRLEIDGNDLIAAGVPEGPQVGARLAVALRRKREGALAGRAQELRAALDGEPHPDHSDRRCTET
jgi:tRNA nucleotidyltransferase (CCA-adding enzyme)